MRYYKGHKFENKEEMFRHLYFDLAQEVSEHIKYSKNLEKTLNDTLEIICQNDENHEFQDILIKLSTY
ncbi:MAG: hypothetical protein R3Y09_01455 [Clostridia bacterium]